MQERMIDKAQIRKIHTLVAVLNMPDILYRRMLADAFSVSSSKQLTFVQARRCIMVLDDFAHTFRRGERPYYEAHFADLGFRYGMATPTQLQKIEALWNSLYPSRTDDQATASLRAFLSHRFKTSDMRFLDSRTAAKVLYALQAIKARRNKAAKTAPETYLRGEAVG